MADVWLLHESMGGTELFRADAIEHLRSDRQQVVARRVGGDAYTSILHISDRTELPTGFAVKLVQAIGQARWDHPDDDSVIVIKLQSGRWQLEASLLSDYDPSA
ncbi:hypothetical protein [Streptomyces sp. NPDC051546]|uniref:hypothetical protein n=1 Tax=Streptomyces sp. NPDC051546 TaxID=3365655 RepID=UPI003793B0AF